VGSVCTSNAACADVFGCTVNVCDPGNPAADPVTGCVTTEDDALCDDGIACTIRVCAPGELGVDANGCTYDLDNTVCEDDGFTCTQELCSPTAVGADPVTGCWVRVLNAACFDDDSCTEDICDPARAVDSSGCTHPVHPFHDDDGDGYADADTCGGPDCNDDCAAINPGQVEGGGCALDADGADNDCNYLTPALQVAFPTSAPQAAPSYPAGDCTVVETTDYSPDKALGPPDCTNCYDYLCDTPGAGGYEPCSWFHANSATRGGIALLLDEVVHAIRIVVYLTYRAENLFNAITSPTGPGPPFEDLLDGVLNGTVPQACSMPRAGDDFTVTYDLLSTGPRQMQGMQLVPNSSLTGIDAVRVEHTTEWDRNPPGLCP
jgi:hypothetical protein